MKSEGFTALEAFPHSLGGQKLDAPDFFSN